MKFFLMLIAITFGIIFIALYIFNYCEMRNTLKRYNNYYDLEVISLTFRQFFTLYKIADLKIDAIEHGIISYQRTPHHAVGFDFNFLTYILITPIIFLARLHAFYQKMKNKRNVKREEKVKNNQKLLSLLNDISATQ